MTGGATAMRFAACLVMAFLVWSGASAQAESPTFFGKGNQYVAYASPKLTATQSRELATFKAKRPYFAAFAVSEGTGAWGASAGYHDQQLAQKVAVAICQAHSKARDCKVIAAVLPRSVSARSRNASGLSAGAEDYYRKEYLKKVKRQQPGRYAAFAIGNRTAGFETDAKSAADAKLGARRVCEQASLNNLRKADVEIRNALSRLGLDKCKVIEVRKS